MKTRRRVSGGVELARAMAIVFATRMPAFGQHVGDADIPSSGDWMYLSMVLVIALGIAVVSIWAERRYRNPSTGRRSRVKARRARGPLKH